jgi:hypothetical protein
VRLLKWVRPLQIMPLSATHLELMCFKSKSVRVIPSRYFTVRSSNEIGGVR